MSTIYDVTKKCAICGKESSQTALGSSNRFGSPDLDLRPPEMMRSTMCWWLEECPYCGYISNDISEATNITEEWLKSNEYLSCDGISFKSDLAKQFYKSYLIDQKNNDDKGAFYSVLHAAWACDDVCDKDNAVYCRKCALDKLDKMLSLPDASDELLVLKADLLRRSGQFDTLINEYRDLKLSAELLNQIISFQIRMAEKQDTSCYTVADATD